MFRSVMIAAIALLCASSAQSETGYASYYGPGFHGKRTANGERYDQNAQTCAHKTRPFNTTLTVTDERTGRSITCRVTDRGPFIRGRIVDLSVAGAKSLGIYQAGVARVIIQ